MFCVFLLSINDRAKLTLKVFSIYLAQLRASLSSSHIPSTYVPFPKSPRPDDRQQDTDILQRTNPALSPGLFASPTEALRKTWAQASLLSLCLPCEGLNDIYILSLETIFFTASGLSVYHSTTQSTLILWVGHQWQQVREEDLDYHPTAAEGAK